MRGHCKCRNIEINWQLIDYSLIPRACQCSYCRAKDAAYVSKPGSKFTVTIHKPDLHHTVTHGSRSALFHECTNCGDLVFVTAEIEGDTYGVLNANCLQNKRGFGAPIETRFSTQGPTEKQHRWRQNWCHPISINSE